jgi:hypothetical protein
MQGYLSCCGTLANSDGGWTTMDCTFCWVPGIFIFILRVRFGYHNLIHERREARNLYSEATLQVGRLKQCLDAVKTALSASEEETNVAQMRVDEAHARVAGKISLKILCFYIYDFI